MRPEDRELGIGKDRILALKIKAAAKLGPRTLITTKAMTDQEEGSVFEATKRAITEIFRDKVYRSTPGGGATAAGGGGEMEGDFLSVRREAGADPSKETQEVRGRIKQGEVQAGDESGETPEARQVLREQRTETDENRNSNVKESTMKGGDEPKTSLEANLRH